jgi:hypothetical protein
MLITRCNLYSNLLPKAADGTSVEVDLSHVYSLHW